MRIPPASSRLLASMAKAVCSALVASALMVWLPPAQASTLLSDNTSEAPTGTLQADATQWLAASFTTDQTYDTLAQWTATVLGQTDASTGASSGGTGSATLSLYSSDAFGLVPDSALATFTAVASTHTATTYRLTGVALSANTAYWLVLSNSTGASNWAWTDNSAGTGTGFTGNWANSDDAGSTWFTNSNLYPLQAAVQVTAESSIPEPATWALLLVGLSGAALVRLASQAMATEASEVDDLAPL
jgi:hypothetical protein